MKKQNKVITYVKEHKAEIIINICGIVVSGLVGAGLMALLLKTDSGKLYKALSRFGKSRCDGQKIVDGIVEFVNNADGIIGLTDDGGATIADLGDDVAYALREMFGIEPATKVSGLLIGTKK